MTEKKRTRVEQLEQFSQLVARDLNNIVAQLNNLGNILQATVNVLGPGAVQNEMARLAAPPGQHSPPPVSEEQKAAEETPATIEGAMVEAAKMLAREEPGADATKDGLAEST